MKWAATGILMVVLITVGSASLAGAIYKWKDANGRIYIGDRPPADDSVAEQISVRAINTYKSATVAERDDSVGNTGRQVVIYTTRSCGYCNKAKAFLREHAIPFTEYDVEQSSKGKRDYKKLKGRGVPIIMVGNQRLNGFNESYLTIALNKAGYTL